MCTDVHCTRHMSEIEHLYCSIVNVMLVAGRKTIPHSKHNEYCERGRPDSGFYFEMRKYSRNVYHAKRKGHEYSEMFYRKENE